MFQLAPVSLVYLTTNNHNIIIILITTPWSWVSLNSDYVTIPLDGVAIV